MNIKEYIISWKDVKNNEEIAISFIKSDMCAEIFKHIQKQITHLQLES